MHLRDYLKENSITIAEAARILGVSYTHFQFVCTGKRYAGVNLARQIESWTHGKVTMIEMIKPYKLPAVCPTCLRRIGKESEKSILHENACNQSHSSG